MLDLATKRKWLTKNRTALRGLVLTSFDAEVDVTGAANGWGLTRVGRFQRRGFARYISGTGVSDRGVEVMQCLTLVHSHRIAGIPVSIRNSNGDAFRRSVKAECICRAI